MKLYIKQRVFSLKDRFEIYSENEEVLFRCEGDFFTLGKKRHLFDNVGREIAYIEQKVLSFLPRYTIYIPGEEAAVVVKNFTFSHQSYDIEKYGWSVEGDFMAHEYDIFDEFDKTIATVHKRWLAWGDTYEIDIENRDNLTRVLATVLVIDACIDNARAAASSAH